MYKLNVFVVVWSANDSMKVSIFVCHVQKYRYRMYRYYMFLFGSNCTITSWFSVRNLYTVYIHIFRTQITSTCTCVFALFWKCNILIIWSKIIVRFFNKKRVSSAFMCICQLMYWNDYVLNRYNVKVVAFKGT